MRLDSRWFVWPLTVLALALGPSGHGLAQSNFNAPPASARLGINLAGPADWATELPFVDVFRTSRPWISQRKGAGWGQGPHFVFHVPRTGVYKTVKEVYWAWLIAFPAVADRLLSTLEFSKECMLTFTALLHWKVECAPGTDRN